MIAQVRVDDRLIHGQVALVWTKELGTNRIIVANKHAVESDALRMTLQMGTPAGQKLLVKDVPDACRIVNDPRADSMRIFALTNCVKDVLELVKGCPGKIEGVNIANVGRFDKTDPATKVNLNSTIMLNPEELEAAKELCELDVPVFHQLIPSNPKVSIKELIEKATK
ncbi:PTS sugar transporter subunit IIB [Enorma sp.]|jgi:fructoselysine and glucoselysine-specific PTS system IIB component|uniref:PTS system mannose/fructose/N-acetylgalactosamine-transporter subunit IIB n=1 Tax=Enorma sp. TaxID=1920692 RepID=UPI0025BC27D1|nr:PTS sugar transporter subunit IIB [Enorma sp.]